MKTRKTYYYVAQGNEEGEYQHNGYRYTFKPELGYTINGVGYRWNGSAWRCTDLESGLLIKICKCDRKEAIKEMEEMSTKISQKKLEPWIQTMIQNMKNFLVKHGTQCPF